MRRGPDPAEAHSPAEFMELMRQLRLWADLSYRQLERNAANAGDVLPRATISAALSRNDLPRAELLAAYVRACGGDSDTVSAWLDTRRHLSLSGTAAPPPTTADSPQTTAAADGRFPQETPPEREATPHEQRDPGTADEPDADPADPPGASPADSPDPGPADPPDAGPPPASPQHRTEAADDEEPESGTGPADSPHAPATEPDAGQADDTASASGAASVWRRQGPLVAIVALTVAGMLALAFWPHDNRPDDHRADSAPTSAAPPDTAPDTPSRPPTFSPTTSPSATAEPPAAAPDASPVEHQETAPSTPPTSAPAPTRTTASAQAPAAGWTRIHPAAAPSLCLTEGRERNGRSDREIAVQHPCADAPLPRVYLEKLGGQTYRIQWHHPDPAKGLGCLAVDDASTASGALLAPRDCADSDSQKFRLEASGGGFRLRPLRSNLCMGFLPPATGGAEAVQTACTATTSQAFTFTAS